LTETLLSPNTNFTPRTEIFPLSVVRATIFAWLPRSCVSFSSSSHRRWASSTESSLCVHLRNRATRPWLGEPDNADVIVDFLLLANQPRILFTLGALESLKFV
jgi:hypothetical protein